MTADDNLTRDLERAARTEALNGPGDYGDWPLRGDVPRGWGALDSVPDEVDAA